MKTSSQQPELQKLNWKTTRKWEEQHLKLPKPSSRSDGAASFNPSSGEESLECPAKLPAETEKARRW